jgi:K+ transporter
VWLLVGGVFGFGSVFLEIPGAAFALVGLIVVVFTTTRREDLVRVAGYLAGVGMVGDAVIGPALSAHNGETYAYATVGVVAAYAFLLLAGALLAGWLAVEGLRRRKPTR